MRNLLNRLEKFSRFFRFTHDPTQKFPTPLYMPYLLQLYYATLSVLHTYLSINYLLLRV